MRKALLAPELRELLEEGRRDDLRVLLEDLHPHDAAQHLSGLEDREIVDALSLLPIGLERDVFRYLDPESQEDIVVGSGRQRVKALLQAMPSDERYEFLDGLSDRVRESLVPLLEQAARADFLRREQYGDDQVGSILSTEYCALRADMVADAAIGELRRQAPSKETIYYCYVVDEEGRLDGVVSLRDLLTARPRQLVRDLMKAAPVSIPVEADQEDAAILIRDYDLLALPVVDSKGILLGIVTYDDAADIQEEEDTEDIERMAGVTGEAVEIGGYIAEPALSLIRRRVPLIAFLAFFNLSTAYLIHTHESSLQFAVLLALLPTVMATGGMVGTQASSLVIRGLTLGEIKPGAFLKVAWKELRVAGGIAVVLGGILFAEGLILGWSDLQVGDNLGIVCGAIGLAMATHAIGSGLFGVTVPILAVALGKDPALVSTPAVTAIADLFGASVFIASVSTFIA